MTEKTDAKMSAMAFLMLPQELQKKMFAKESRIWELRTLEEKATALLSPTPGGDHNDRKIENITVQITELEAELAGLKRIRDNKILEIADVLSRMSNAAYSVLLMEHYIETKSIAAIARDHQYAKRNTEKRLHAACNAFRQLYDELMEEGKIGPQQNR